MLTRARARIDHSASSLGVPTPLNRAFEIETELQYFTPRATLERFLGVPSQGALRIPGTTVELIRQHSFPKDEIESCARRILEHYREHKRLRNLDPQVFTQARLRVVFYQGQRSYTLEAKGPKREDSRLEIGIPLTRGEYLKERARADHGMLEKFRFIVAGEVYGMRHGRPYPVKAQIAAITHAGPGGTRCASACRAFTLVDVELPPALVYAFRHGNHSLSFLKPPFSTELSLVRREIAKPLSARRLARDGYGEEAQHSVACLLEQCRLPPFRRELLE